MAKKVKYKRVIFPEGTQNIFFQSILKRFSISDIARTSDVSERTIRDWYRERFSVDLDSLRKLCKKYRILFPSNVEIRDRYWYAKKGARLGGIARFQKYGCVGLDEKYRKEKWLEWWRREGKYKKTWKRFVEPMVIERPEFSKQLAEFVGIMLGDGGISDYQIMVTLNSQNEKEYASFISTLIKNLFRVPVTIHYRKNEFTLNLVISRIELVRFCIQKLGLKKGNKIKNQVDIPRWVKNKREYFAACIRGLIDTDGTVFVHKYKIKGKLYSYKKLSFTSHSKPLRDSVFYALQTFGLHPRRAGNFDIRLDRIDDVRKYFHIVGSHNARHLKRYQK